MKKMARFFGKLLELAVRIVLSVLASFIFGTLIYVLGVFIMVFVFYACAAVKIDLPIPEIVAFYGDYGFRIIFIIVFIWLMGGKSPPWL